MKTQEALEQEMAELGEARYLNNHQKAVDRGLESTSAGARRLLQESVGRFVPALEEWLKEAEAGTPGFQRGVAPYIRQVPSEIVGVLVCRAVLDGISQQRVHTQIAASIGSVLEDEARCAYLEESQPHLWADIERNFASFMSYRARRQKVKGSMQTIGEDWDAWPHKERVQIGVVLLHIFKETTGLIRIENRRDYFGRQVTEVEASDSCLHYLEHAHNRSRLLAPVYLPCIEQPNDWVSPLHGGFHSDKLHRRALVKTHSRKWVEEIEQIDMPEVYSAVNAVQAARFRVNRRVYEVMEAFWEAGIPVGGLMSRDDLEIPAKPIDIATNESARKAWRKEARIVHRQNVASRSRRVQMAKSLYVADRFREDDFWFVTQLDTRGRLYPIGYHLHPQGPDHIRSLLEFGDGKVVGEHTSASVWLALAGANAFGLDKESTASRLSWVEGEGTELAQEIASKPLQSRRLWEEADKPWAFLAWCFDFADWLKDPEGHVSHLIVPQDATQSGIQIMSLLMRDEVGAHATNVVGSDKPSDLYGLVAQKLLERMERDAELEGSIGQIARMWLDYGIDRSTTKRVVMTRVYNATIFSSIRYVREWYQAKGPLPVSHDFAAVQYLAKGIWAAMDEVCESTTLCMDWLTRAARVVAATGQEIRWTAPQGFPVRQFYNKWDAKLIRTHLGATVRSTKLRDPNDQVDRRKMANALAPNFVHSLDAAALMKTVNLCVERGVHHFAMVHDSYGTLAADCEVMSGALREAYVDIFNEDVLKRFKEEVEAHTGCELPPLPEYGDLDPSEVLQSDYFFN